MAGDTTKSMMRLNKFLATYGNVSRREADKLVFAGRVNINGSIADSPGIQVDVDKDSVVLDNKPIVYSTEDIYLKFYKPTECLTAYGDGRGRKNLNNFQELKESKIPYSGRLDYDSEGLIIFTNNGDMIYKLQKPEYKVAKEYIVHTNRDLKPQQMEQFANGLTVEDIKYGACHIGRMGPRLYGIILFEGKKRQIRKMFQFFEVRVRELKRISIGPIRLGDMKLGEIRELDKDEIKELHKCTG